jgi:hypothetical protein
MTDLLEKLQEWYAAQCEDIQEFYAAHSNEFAEGKDIGAPWHIGMA